MGRQGLSNTGKSLVAAGIVTGGSGRSNVTCLAALASLLDDRADRFKADLRGVGRSLEDDMVMMRQEEQKG